MLANCANGESWLVSDWGNEDALVLLVLVLGFVVMPALWSALASTCCR